MTHNDPAIRNIVHRTPLRGMARNDFKYYELGAIFIALFYYVHKNGAQYIWGKFLGERSQTSKPEKPTLMDKQVTWKQPG